MPMKRWRKDYGTLGASFRDGGRTRIAELAAMDVPVKKNGAAWGTHPLFWQIVAAKQVARGTMDFTANIDRRYQFLYKLAQKSAAKREIPFELTPEEFQEMLDRSDGHCELSGRKFTFMTTHSRNPYCPSIDRIDCSKGYTADNCRLICGALNIAMNVWGLDVLLDLTDAVRRRYKP